MAKQETDSHFLLCASIQGRKQADQLSAACDVNFQRPDSHPVDIGNIQRHRGQHGVPYGKHDVILPMSALFSTDDLRPVEWRALLPLLANPGQQLPHEQSCNKASLSR